MRACNADGEYGGEVLGVVGPRARANDRFERRRHSSLALVETENREERRKKRSREEKEEIPTRRTFQSSRTVLGSCVCQYVVGLATPIVGEALRQPPAVGRLQGRFQ